MFKPRSVILYIFVMMLFILLFASFDAEPYFVYSASLGVNDAGMYRSLTDNMEGLEPKPVTGDDDFEPVTQYVLNDESSVIKAYKFTLYYLDYIDYPTNGIFDSVLKKAIEKYQAERLLTVNGILDEKTMESLDSEVLVYTEGKYGDPIIYYKDRLQSLSYYEHGTVLGDAFDEELTEILKAYQKNNGLVVTGILDVDTQVCLRKPLENQADAEGNILHPDDNVISVPDDDDTAEPED